MRVTEGGPLLREALPAFADELRGLLDAQAPGLAPQVEALRVVARCACTDDFCGMFYTAPPPEGSYGSGLENVVLEPKRGMIILDVVDGQIAAVEVLFRDDVRAALDAAGIPR
ncbi:MAG TPA: hypothetical protein VD962_13595 [Rubricoccaceae bacterium]|nr:hypothetical protein [Rubricoccaceae bacterium]